MIIEHLTPITISSNKLVRDALVSINESGRGICFILNNNKLIGIATDGDIRRHMLAGGSLEDDISMCMNTQFVCEYESNKMRNIEEKFNHRIRYVPVLDESGALKSVAYTNVVKRIPVLEPQLSGNELYYLEDCVRTNWISSQGEYVKRFESQFQSMHQNFDAVSTSNGTTALHLALLALGIGEGDEVIVPNITFAASINAILYTNAIPVICEVNKHSWCIEPSEINKLLTNKTRAIMPVHLYGQVCDMDEIKKIALENDLLIIEDCAEAIGSKLRGQPVGVFGDAATFSFFGNKTISTGEGGMVIFKKSKHAQSARILRDHGMDPNKRYWHNDVGFNYRLTNLQAAIGVAQMERFDHILNKKRNIFDFYMKNLNKIRGIDYLPRVYDHIFNSNWLFTIIISNTVDRQSLLTWMSKRGIELRPCFYMLSEMPPYIKFRSSESLVNSTRLSTQGLSLPSSVNLTHLELEHIVDNLKEYFELVL